MDTFTIDFTSGEASVKPSLDKTASQEEKAGSFPGKVENEGTKDLLKESVASASFPFPLQSSFATESSELCPPVTSCFICFYARGSTIREVSLIYTLS